MKNVIVLFVAAILIIAPATFARNHHVYYSSSDNHNSFLDGVDLDIDHRSIVLTNEDYDDNVVEITRNYELYVNDKRIDLDPKQEQLVSTFYDQTFDLMDTAKAIGLEGARVGLAGAKVGFNALIGLVRLLSPEYDTDDLEEDIDRQAAKIEARADELEQRAEQVEDMAYEVEKSFDRMMDGIPALRELDWSYDLTIGPRVHSDIRASVSAPAAPAAPAAPEAPSSKLSRTGEVPE